MPEEAVKIGPSTAYAYCSERLSPFGGRMRLVKFMDLVEFKEIFDKFYKPPSRKPWLGHYSMVYGLIMLLFIGFNRIWHFIYIQLDAMLCSILHVDELPYVTTFWRYVASLGLNQGTSWFLVMSALRERIWHLCGIHYETIHIDIDTTVETIYGNQEGGRKGHNTQHRGKKGFRPVLCFIEETREYFSGKLRRGETMCGAEVSSLIRGFKKFLARNVPHTQQAGSAGCRTEKITEKLPRTERERGGHWGSWFKKISTVHLEKCDWRKIQVLNALLYQCTSY